VSDQAIKDIVNFETWVGAGGPKPVHLQRGGDKTK
jgi:hypothetical protein